MIPLNGMQQTLSTAADTRRVSLQLRPARLGKVPREEAQTELQGGCGRPGVLGGVGRRRTHHRTGEREGWSLSLLSLPHRSLNQGSPLLAGGSQVARRAEA